MHAGAAMDAGPIHNEAMRRRLRLWIAIVVFLCAIVVLPALQPDPYGFLSDFHPRRVRFVAAGGNTTGEGYVLVFSRQYSKSVLESMESHLTAAKDYFELNGSGMWIFRKGHTEIFEHGAAYATQGHERELLPNMANLPVVEPGGCVVMIDPGPTWIGEELNALKQRLGMR